MMKFNTRTPAAPLQNDPQLQATDNNPIINRQPTNAPDTARLGLARELMQVILGLSNATAERVIQVISESPNIDDINTINMRQRIGNRAMRYLRNSIDQARNEGTEKHNNDPTMDQSKFPDLEPGHASNNQRPIPTQHQNTRPNVSECITPTFKNFITELNMNVDLQDPGAATAEIKRAAKMGATQAADVNIQKAKGEMDQAKDTDPSNPMKSLDMRIASLNSQLAQLQRRKAQIQQTQNSQVQQVQQVQQG